MMLSLTNNSHTHMHTQPSLLHKINLKAVDGGRSCLEVQLVPDEAAIMRGEVADPGMMLIATNVRTGHRCCTPAQRQVTATSHSNKSQQQQQITHITVVPLKPLLRCSIILMTPSVRLCLCVCRASPSWRVR